MISIKFANLERKSECPLKSVFNPITSTLHKFLSPSFPTKITNLIRTSLKFSIRKHKLLFVMIESVLLAAVVLFN